MKPSIRCFEICTEFEGEELVAYRKADGIWTIGRGHTAGVKEGDTCTAEEAAAWQVDDLAESARKVDSVLRGYAIMQNEYDALVSFVSNVRLGEFFRLWNAGEFEAASSECHLLWYVFRGAMKSAAGEWLKWNHISGIVSAGLTRRREVELALFMGVPRPRQTL